MKNSRTQLGIVGMALAALAFLAACSSEQVVEGSRAKTRLSIATGGTGGVYYPYGGGIAKIITEHISNVEATAEVTAASVDNLKFLNSRKADIAFTTADTLADAINGTGSFKSGKLPIQAIAVLYPNYTHVVTLASSAIRTIADLKGKVVSTGSPGSGTEVTADRVLAAYGLKPESDIQRQSLGVSESADALKDGKIAAFFWNGGLPTGAILALAHTPGVTIRMLSDAGALESMKKTYGSSLYLRANVPKATYPGLDGDVDVVSIPNLLVVHQEMDEALVHEIARVLFEHKRELAAIHPEAEKLTLPSATQGSPAPFHPGAIRYYEEQRVWPH